MSLTARRVIRVIIFLFVGSLGLIVLPSVRSAIGCMRRGQFAVDEIAYVGLAILIPIAILIYWKERLAAKLLIAAGALAFFGTTFARCNWTPANKVNAAIGLVLYAGLMAGGWWLKTDSEAPISQWPTM